MNGKRRALTALIHRPLVGLTVVSLLAGGLLAVRPWAAHANPTHYVELSDSTLIAINVRVPAHCTAATPCPTVLEMAGYENGSADDQTPMGDLADLTGLPLPLQDTSRAVVLSRFEDRYVTVEASLRGTGCSTGEFDLFSYRSALDGKELIDGWIAQQPWSNGDVALFGHSYSGITAMMIASTRPDHLSTVSASGLIGDIYRDIVYPGGISNYGFPLLWTGVYRPLYDYGGGVGGGVFPPADTSDECVVNQTQRSRTVLDDPLVQGLDDTDSEWYRTRSLVNHVGDIDVPVQMTAAYHDEQTGARGPVNTFLALPEGITKRLVLTNGDHGTAMNAAMAEREAWVDYWMLGVERADLGHRIGEAALASVFGPRHVPTTTTRVLLGYQPDGEIVGELHSDGFPLAATQFTDLYVTGGGGFAPEPAAVAAAAYTWLNGTHRQSTNGLVPTDPLTNPVATTTGPDEVELTVRADGPVVIAGPITATLNIAASTPDTELFVQLIDRAPTGELLYLQRGMVRAGHRAIDESRSHFTADGRVWWTYRPHTSSVLVTPGEAVEYVIEVFPVGHVLLPGHELVVKIHAPPATDGIYAYVPKTPPGLNTLHTSPARPSRLMLPLVPLDEVIGFAPQVGPCEYVAMRCVVP